jgi:hypothetical protein
VIGPLTVKRKKDNDNQGISNTPAFKKAGSSEARNYKFYEDIVSFEDNGGPTKGKEHDYQMIGDKVKDQGVDHEKSSTTATSKLTDQISSQPEKKGILLVYS